MFTCQNMGNVATSNDHDGEEWLEDLKEESQFLDFSRKVNHSQFLKHIQGEYTEASLTDFPWAVLDYVSLYTKVNGSFNAINQLSTNLPLRIPHLTHLNLSYNNLTGIPPTIGLLVHLEEFLLRGNKISQLPDEIILIRNLQLLDVSHNVLKALPKDIGKLPNLTRLNVSNNFLNVIPPSLGYSPKLKVLLASNNECSKPPQDICDSSVELLKYLRSQICPVLVSPQFNKFPRVRSNIARSQINGDARSQYVQSQTRTSQPASRTKTPLLLPTNATQLSSEVLVDKILGLIYGAVLGDTLGIATEYLLYDEIEFYYSDGRLSHENIVQDEHRSHFQRGRPTCVSDLMLLVLESIIQWSGVLDELELAHRLIDYSVNGLRETKPFITSTVINKLLMEDHFVSDPHWVATKVARNLNSAVYEDLHPLPMALITGLPQFYNLDEVTSNASRICKTTHAHPVMIDATSTLARIVALMLQGCELDKVMEANNKFKEEHDQGDSDLNPERRSSLQNGIEASLDKKLEIDKVLEEAAHCLEEHMDFESALTRILFLGGQSRIYGSVCGALLGCSFGYSLLPSRWINGLHPSVVSWLNERLNLLLDMMGLP